MGFLDKTGLELLWTHIQQLVNKKITGLATETYVDEKISAIEPPSTEGLASEEYVNTAIANLVDSSPDALNTLNELADALGDDPNFATTVANQIAGKVDKTTKINGKSLNDNITLTASDIGALSDTIVVPLNIVDDGHGSRTNGATQSSSEYNLGNNSFSQGQDTQSSGIASHAEGVGTIASGDISHAEGDHTIASGWGSHAEGNNTIASSSYQHVAGKYNIADENGDYAYIIGNGSHENARKNAHTVNWDGTGWFANEVYVGGKSQDDENAEKLVKVSEVEEAISVKVDKTTTINEKALSENIILTATDVGALPNTIAVPTNLMNGSATGSLKTINAKAEKNGYTLGENAFAQGYSTLAAGTNSHAEGRAHAYGENSHAEGSAIAYGKNAHAEGSYTIADYIKITGEANTTTYTIDKEDASRYLNLLVVPVTGDFFKPSIIIGVEGNTITVQNTLSSEALSEEYVAVYYGALGESSHCEGTGTLALGSKSHSEGSGSSAIGASSHAEGTSTRAEGAGSHAEGMRTRANGYFSHAEGFLTYANGMWQHVQGKNNIIDEENIYAHIVGNGESDTARSNAHTLDWSGNGWFAGEVYVGGASQSDTTAEKLVKQSELEAAMPSSDTPLQMLTTDAEGNTAWQNQTHYNYTAIGEIYPETTFTESDINGDNILLTSPLKLELGKSYTVKYNGTEYYCTPYDNGTYYVLGNAQAVGGSFSDEPFTILTLQNASSSPYGHLIPHDGSTSGSFSVLGEKEFIKTIDKKYLPTTLKNLAGKTFLILGDSINAGNGWAGGFANLIAEDFPEATVVNNAVEGSLLSGDNKAIYYQAVRAYQAGIRPDYIIIDGGGNDLLGQATVGTVDLDTYSAEGYGEEFDISTIAGAFEYLITNVQKFNPHAKIIFFNLFKVLPAATEIPLASQRAAWSMLKTACEKYSVKYVDLFNEGNFNPYCEEQWNAFMYDWVHINEAGYRRFWPLIRDAL